MSWRKASEPAIAASATAAIETVIAGRKRDIGGFSVERLLPAMARRHVGPTGAGGDRIHPAAGSVK